MATPSPTPLLSSIPLSLAEARIAALIAEAIERAVYGVTGEGGVEREGQDTSDQLASLHTVPGW